MKEIKIEFDDKKRLRNVVLGILGSILLGCLAYVMIFESRVIYIYPILIISAGAIFALFFSVKTLLSVFNGDKTALILSDKGLLFKGTQLGRKVGLVEWCDVETMRTETAFGKKGVYLRLGNPKYFENISNDASVKSLYEKGLPVTTDELSIKNVQELESLITKYLRTYRESSTESLPE